MCMGFVNNYQTLYALRLLLGLFEGPLVPAIAYITAMYYKRTEHQVRLTFIYMGLTFAGAFGGVSFPQHVCCESDSPWKADRAVLDYCSCLLMRSLM